MAESAREVAQILMGNPKAMQTATGTSFNTNRLNDILANGSLSDINRMNNALAKNLRDNGENPYRVIKAANNAKIEQANAKKANRVEKMAASGERFEQRGKQFFGVTSEGDFKATMGEYHYYNYLTQHKNDTAQKQEQNTAQPQQKAPQEKTSASNDTGETNLSANDTSKEVSKDKGISVVSNNNTVGNDSTVQYQTESGKPINEAEEQEFIVNHNGDKNFGEISQAVETKNNGIVKSAPIRLQVGNEHFGYIHLLKHAEQVKQKGYDIMGYINHILNNFTQIYSQQTPNKPNRFVLYCNDKSKGFMPIDLEFEQNAKGYYTIVSLMPHRAKIKGTLLFDGSANPSTVTADGTLLDESSNNGGAATSPNTHEKSNVPSTPTVPQKQQNVKGKNLKSVIIGGEKYYIDDTPSVPPSDSGKKRARKRKRLHKPIRWLNLPSMAKRQATQQKKIPRP